MYRTKGMRLLDIVNSMCLQKEITNMQRKQFAVAIREYIKTNNSDFLEEVITSVSFRKYPTEKIQKMYQILKEE